MSQSQRTARIRPLETVKNEARSLVTGALVFRWVWLVWMAALAAMSQAELQREWLVWASIGAATAWTLWLTLARSSWNTAVLLFDVGLCVWLICVSAFVVGEGEIISGRPFFATGYPLSCPLLWGALRGPGAGVLTAAALAVAHLLSRPLNGIELSELSPGQVQNVTGAMLNYFVGGIAVGLVARLVQRYARAVEAANEETVKERELSARLAERESLAREIHDSVLQSLALVHKRGKELASHLAVDPRDVAELAEIAGKQQEELRTLILRDPEPAPVGRASLRDALESTSRAVEGIDVDVSAIGPLWAEARTVTELQAAVRQALENAARHSGAARATVFAEEEDGALSITVRDDGAGFEFDEKKLVQQGKVGILKSMKGRVEDLGGTMTIASAPVKGTEIEFRVPADHD
jgi:signal transduction histidine kinase